MRCIYCGADSKRKDRQANDGQCVGCGHPFAFEPIGSSPGVTDMQFKRAIEAVSGQGATAFTERELWHEFSRRIHAETASCWTVLGGGFAVLFFLLGSISLWFLPLAGAVFAGVILAQRAQRRAPPRLTVPFERFREKYLARWTEVHGPIEKLLPPPGDAPPLPAPPGASPGADSLPAPDLPPDLTAYSFDRALVTCDAETAAMLVANNFHFENNCAILSLDGYPPGIADTVMTMLRKNPNLIVFAVHGASVPGCSLALRLREEPWFPDPAVRIVDLGLRPRDAWRLRLPVIRGMRQTVPEALRQRLDAEEATWLAEGNVAELAALRPAKLMRAIYQGFARANQPDTTDGVAPAVFIWGHDSGAGVYAMDSFG